MQSLITFDTCADIFMFRSKTAPGLPTIKNWYYYTIYGNDRNIEFCPHLWGTPHSISVYSDRCIDGCEAIFRLCCPHVDHRLIDRFDRDVELCIIRISITLKAIYKKTRTVFGTI